MSLTIKPFKELVALTKEKVDEALAPIRARAARAKANLEVAKLEEELLSIESNITKLCTEKDLDLNKIIGRWDEHALKERKLKQVQELVSQLFPE